MPADDHPHHDLLRGENWENRLIQHAIAMNNAGIKALTSASATSRRGVIMATLTEALTTFQMVLSLTTSEIDDELSSCSCCRVLDAEKDDVGIVFGSPIASLGTAIPENGDAAAPSSITGDNVDTATGHYLFNYTISLRYFPATDGSSSRATPRQGSQDFTTTNQRMDGDERLQDGERQAEESTPWRGAMSLQVYVGCTIFNMALVHHAQGIVRRKRKILESAAKLYQSAGVLLCREVEGRAAACHVAWESEDPFSSSSLAEEATRRRRSLDSSIRHLQQRCSRTGDRPATALKILQIACWNNLSHVRYSLGSFRQASLCLSMVVRLSEHTTLNNNNNNNNNNNTNTNSTVNPIRSAWIRRNNSIAQELLNQSLLNHLLLWNEPRLAAAA